MNDRIINKVDPGQVKVGDIMTFTYYVKVKNATSDRLIVEDLDHENSELQINGTELIQNALSANFFTETQKIGKTQAAEILVQSVNRPFSVSFVKADGTSRELIGRLIKPEPLLGRSMVEDLELPKSEKNRIRQVDHRTIEWIIVEGVKYTVN